MRFSADKCKNMETFTFLAFSAGPRYVFYRFILSASFKTLEIALVNILLFIN